MQHTWSLGEIADAIGVAVDFHIYEGKLNLKGVPTTDPMGSLFNYTIVSCDRLTIRLTLPAQSACTPRVGRRANGHFISKIHHFIDEVVHLISLILEPYYHQDHS